MDMKWHPIIDGDLSGIPKDKTLLLIEAIKCLEELK